MKPPLSPSQHSAIPMAPVPEGILQLLRALPRLEWLLLLCLQHPLLLLPGFLALCPTAAPAASASSQCSSFVHLVFVQCCSWKCLWQLWPVGTGTFLVHPSLLCSPGSASVPWFSSTRGCSLPAAQSHPLPRGHLWNKATSPSTSVTARGAGALLPLALLFNFLFPNQKWPKKRDGELST